jgi:hypothetical protein
MTRLAEIKAKTRAIVVTMIAATAAAGVAVKSNSGISICR